MKMKESMLFRNRTASFRKSHLVFRVLSLILTMTMIVGGIISPLTLPIAQASDPATETPPAHPKNVIILISDGMGYNHQDAASYYEHGEVDTQVYESFPYQFSA